MTATLLSGKMNTPRMRLEQAQRWLNQVEVPAPVVAVLRCVLWLNSVDSFRETEMDQAEAPQGVTSGHRVALCDLIADGEAIVWLVKSKGWPESFKEFTLADVEATLESLHTTFRCRYGPRLHPERKAELAAWLDA